MRMRRWMMAAGLLATSPLALAGESTPVGCSDVNGWQDGRAGKGRRDGCATQTYAEAHRLGASLHELEVEHRAIAHRLAEGGIDDIGAQQRRQRQLDNDIEAIRGVATVKGWPLEPARTNTP